MKKLLSALLIALLAATAVLPVSATSIEDKDGQAEIELTAAGITLIDPSDDTATAGLPSAFQGLSGISIDFRIETLTGSEQLVNAKDDERLGIIVSDLRGQGGGSTWNVTAQLGRFEQAGEATLEGAVLILTPSGNVIPEHTSENAATALTQRLTSGEGAARVFHSAPLTKGSAGLWATEWTPQLQIFANAESGKHQADLTWTLFDGV